MVLLFERLFCHSLKNSHKLDNHRPQLLSPPLGAFLSHLSDCLNQLQLNNNSDESFVPPSSVSLPWILRCLELLPAVNKAFAKLVMDINDYPISKWAAASVDEHLSITLTLLNYLNSIASSLSHLSHARLAMSHALGLLESSPALAIERLQGAIQYFNINPAKEHYLKVEENVMKAASTNREERLSSSGEERAIQEALTAVKSIGFWVSAAVLAGLSGDSKPYLDMKNAIAAAGTSRKVPYSSLLALDSSFRAAVIDGRPIAIREVGRVNEAAACLVAALEEGKDTAAAAAEELGRELEEMQRLLDAIGKEANGIFSEILAHRHELLDRENSAEDIKHVNPSIIHYLSGPIKVMDADGIPAKPGDLLLVEICNLGPLPGDEWGYTATFDRENGGGFLTDHFPCATKAIWYFEGIYAYSPQIPGVRFPGLTHPGIIGTAPSMELLHIWNKRERELEETGAQTLKLCEVLHSRPLANLPSADGCLLGKIQEGTAEWAKIANEAARTVPGRENGGNCDIKNLSRGSKIYLPVFVDGANFSTGDMHFSQGDGEVSFCGAIEMSGFLELKCEIIRNGMKEYLTPMGPTPLHVNPIFEIGPVEPRFSEWLVFEGISVDESGKQHYLDASVAYKRAVLNAIDYLSRFGYSKEQIYLLLSCCPCEGRISGIVDCPNAVATLAIPTAIFDQDVRPKTKKVPAGPRLLKSPDVFKCTYDGDLPTTKNLCTSI